MNWTQTPSGHYAKTLAATYTVRETAPGWWVAWREGLRGPRQMMGRGAYAGVLFCCPALAMLACEAREATDWNRLAADVEAGR